ncbi:MAG: hypothetical protein NWE98_09805 [Candidatus Bathyarchaeota archaeon]|nr:hypothetical protein [Candidatus Bathyarchaeota archaeon]
MEQIFLVAEETFSAVVCFILVWFLIKPYLVTREGRYLGLPLGFGILGATYALAAFAHSYPIFMDPDFSVNDLTWLQLIARPFAFAFLTFTYYFSKKPSKNTHLIWNVILSALLVAVTSLIILVFVAPNSAFGNYRFLSMYIRGFNIACLLYISIHTLRSHLKTQDSKTITTPLGYILLGISQYSLLVWLVDGSTKFPFYGGLVLRWAGLILFLIIAYRTFYGIPKKEL